VDQSAVRPCHEREREDGQQAQRSEVMSAPSVRLGRTRGFPKWGSTNGLKRLLVVPLREEQLAGRAAARLDVQASSCRPARVTGRPSKPSVYVTRGLALGSLSIDEKELEVVEAEFVDDAKMMYAPDGCMYGAQLIEPKSVICF